MYVGTTPFAAHPSTHNPELTPIHGSTWPWPSELEQSSRFHGDDFNTLFIPTQVKIFNLIDLGLFSH